MTTYSQQPERLIQRGETEALIRRNARLRTALIELLKAAQGEPNTDLPTAISQANQALGE